jgi:hypothetical protein
MNNFAQSIGERTASIVDGTVDLVTSTVDNSRIAATAFGKGYSEQHSLNLKRRAARRMAREMRINLRSNAVITVRPAWRAS